MPLPFTQRFPPEAENFGVWDYLIRSPNRDLILTWVQSGSPDSEGYKQGAHIWSNTDMEAVAYDGTLLTDLWGPDLGDGQPFFGFRPLAIGNDGTLYGKDMGTNPLYEGIPQAGVFAKWPNFFAGEKTVITMPGGVLPVGTDMRVFEMPDGTERVMVQGPNVDFNTPGDWYVYNVADETFDTISPPNPVGYSYFPYDRSNFAKPIQDLYGDIWMQAQGTLSSVPSLQLFRAVTYGDNPTAIDDLQIIEDMPDFSNAEFNQFSPNGFLAFHGSDFTQYITRLDDLDTDTWTIAETVDFGGGTLVGPALQKAWPQYHASDASFWVTNWTGVESGDLGDTGQPRTVSEIDASTLAILRTVSLNDWIIEAPDGPDYEQIWAIDHTRPALICLYSNVTGAIADRANSISWRYFSAEPGPPGQVDDDIRIRVWGHKLDGHTFYHLRIGDERGTFTYDLTTGQWAEYASPELTRWRPHVGCNWVGMAGTITLGGSDVVCGDDTTGTLWVLDPDAGTDDDAVTGVATMFDRAVTGGIPLDGREVMPCGAATASLAVGAPIGPSTRIKLETSDDLGKTFLNHGEQAVPTGAWDTCVEWRSLGLAKAPGRIFRLTDNGATVRISALDLR